MSNPLSLPRFLELYNMGEKAIMDLHEDKNRERALYQLKNVIRHQLPVAMRIHFGFQLWRMSTFNILLKEVTRGYTRFEAASLTMTESTRLCNALDVMQCMASHTISRIEIVRANVLHYVLPYLGMSTSTVWPLQFVRINVLQLIDDIAKFDGYYGEEIIVLLLQTTAFDWCLHYINNACRSIRKAAILILMKILKQGHGLKHCCTVHVRLLSVIQGLCQLVQTLSSEVACPQQLKYVVQCFVSLSQVTWDHRVYDTVRNNFPQQLLNGTFQAIINADQEIPVILNDLVYNLSHPPQE